MRKTAIDATVFDAFLDEIARGEPTDEFCATVFGEVLTGLGRQPTAPIPRINLAPQHLIVSF